MFFFSFRRARRRSRVWIATYFLITLACLDLFAIFRAHSNFSNNLVAATVRNRNDLPPEIKKQKIFICVQLWTSADLIASFWGESLLNLVKTLGPENVYISILESGSLDNTAAWIRYLDHRLSELGVERTVVIDPKTHKNAVEEGPLDKNGVEKEGWIVTGEPEYQDEKQLRRIPYLAGLRNEVLAPMLRMHRNHKRTFDKVLFLNDVALQPSDVLSLLATNEGSYDVACALDFHYPPQIYDTFAVRDAEGDGPVMSTFPYFRAPETRKAMLEGKPARVKSCWNGIIVMDAASFYPHLSHGHEGGAAKLMSGLKFRGISDSLALHHLEASECCLIHADLIASGEAKKGLFINPAVRVGYTTEAWDQTHLPPNERFVSLFQYIKGLWINRFARFRTEGISSSAGQNMNEVYKQIHNWQKEGETKGKKWMEVGDYCTIMEMHILIWNGWKHVW